MAAELTAHAQTRLQASADQLVEDLREAVAALSPDDVALLGALHPGFGTMTSVQGYNTSLDGMDGDDPLGTYSVYWAGTQLPPEVPDNIDPRYNREGGPRLAAFDRALELQTDADGTDPRKVWASHSAGSAMVGSGEKQGMILDAHVYIAPAGPGQGVERLRGALGDDSGDPAFSLPNPHTERYLIQNPKDSIALAQGFQPAQGALGGSTSVDFMFQGNTLALKNVRGVLYEEGVYPEIGMENNWFGERDPLRKHTEEFDTVNDFPLATLDAAYKDATGEERPR